MLYETLELRMEFSKTLGHLCGFQFFWSPIISSTPNAVRAIRAIKNYMQ